VLPGEQLPQFTILALRCAYVWPWAFSLICVLAAVVAAGGRTDERNLWIIYIVGDPRDCIIEPLSDRHYSAQCASELWNRRPCRVLTIISLQAVFHRFEVLIHCTRQNL
jgi:hypothetical protein